MGKGGHPWYVGAPWTTKTRSSTVSKMGTLPKPLRLQQIIDPKMPRAGCHHNGVSLPLPPPDVLRVGERMQYRSEEKLFLVHFFDNKRSWQWLPRSKMVPFGINKTVDKIKLMEGCSSGIRKAVQIAFHRAVSHLSQVKDKPSSKPCHVN